MSEPLTADEHRQLLAEIDAEVARRRASGELPATLERELDAVFARYAPLGALDADTGAVIRRAEEAAFIDVAVPTASQKPGLDKVKLAIRKSVGWYMNYLAAQISEFASTSVRALRLLDERLDGVERASGPLDARALTSVLAAAGEDAPGADAWAPAIVHALAGSEANGRVLHATCGSGALAQALAAAGVDVYGVDPDPRSTIAAASLGLDVRPEAAERHLAGLPDGSLKGLVLSGVVDTAPARLQHELATLAAAKVAPGGTIVVVGVRPEAWGTATSPTLADLAPGRPLRPTTWAALLSAAGIPGASVQGEPGHAMFAVVAHRPA